MPQFDATIKHIKDGVKGFTVKAAVTNIEGWEHTLEGSETPGVKTLVKDLEHLKKLIQDENPKGDQIKKLLAKLGKETVAFAGKAEGKNAEKAKALGEALTHMVDEPEAEKGEPEAKKDEPKAEKDEPKAAKAEKDEPKAAKAEKDEPKDDAKAPKGKKHDAKAE